MGRDYFLDKDIVIDKDRNIYLVYSNINPFGYVYAYIKYVYSGKGLWRGYDRVLRYYGVHNLMKLDQEFIYESCYDVSFPIVRKSRIMYHLKPEEKIYDILKHAESNIESIIVEIYETLGITNVGITGSILADIYHGKSDIDFVIYGLRDTLNFMEQFSGFNEDKDWIFETSSNYGIDIDLAKELYDVRVRGSYKGIKYSFLFVYQYPQKYCERSCKRTEEAEIVADIYDNTFSLFYPSLVALSNVSMIKGSNLPPKILISYEGIYSMLLYKAKRIKARGMLMSCDDGQRIIVIGDRDVKGYVRRLL